MGFKSKLNPSRSAPPRSAPPTRTGNLGATSKMPPRFKPNMPMVPDLSKRPPVPTRTGNLGVMSKMPLSKMPLGVASKNPVGALKSMKAMPKKPMMKKGGAVKKAAAKGKK